MTAAAGDTRAGVFLGLLLLFFFSPASIGQDDPLTRLARDLAGRPWSLRVSVEVSEHTGSPPPTTTVRTSSMRVTYEPGKAVTLALGALRVRAEPGVLIAVHSANRSAVYHVQRPGLSIADLLSDELPPLWCPWLAIALTADPAAWPFVGGTTPGIRWTSRTEPDQTDGPLVIRGVHGSDHTRIEAEIVREPSGPPFLRRYTMHLPRDGRTLRFDFTAVQTDPVLLPLEQPRVPVDSIAALMPSPPPLHLGDRMPPVLMTAFTDENLAAGTFRPADAFVDRDDPARPMALILVLTRPGPDAPGRLTRIARLIRPARLRSGVEGVLARPTIAVNTEETTSAALAPLRRAWRSSYARDITIPNTEARIPDAFWTPASVLLDRIAPDQSTVIVVIDRTGWIVGVLDETATSDSLADALRAAAR